MLWCTRLDIAQAMVLMSKYLFNLEKEYWKAMKWVFKDLRGTSRLCLYFRGSKQVLEGFTDADMISG